MPTLIRVLVFSVGLLGSCSPIGAKSLKAQQTLFHEHTVTALASSDALDRAATGDMRGRVLIWSLSEFAPVTELVAPEDVTRSRVRSLAWSSAGELAVATDWTGAVEVWTGEAHTRTLQAYTGQATAVAWGGDGRLVTGGGDSAEEASAIEDPLGDQAPPLVPSIKVWRDDVMVQQFSVPQGMVQDLAVSEDNRWIAAAAGQTVVIWRADTGTELARLEGVGDVTGLEFQSGDLLVMGSQGVQRASGPDFAAGSVFSTMRAPAAAGLMAGFVILGDYEMVRVYQLPGLNSVAEHPGRAYAMAAVGDGLWIALADELLGLNAQGELSARRSLRAP